MTVSNHTQATRILAKGAGTVMFGMFVSKMLSYFYRIFVARYFGPADYGLFSLALALISFISSVAILGNKNGIIRFVSFYKSSGEMGKVKGTFFSSIRVTLTFSVLVAVLMVYLSPYLATVVFSKPELEEILIILSLSIPFSTVFYVSITTFIGMKRMDYEVFCEQITRNASKLILTVMFGLMGLGLVGITWAWFLALLIALGMSLFLIKTRFLGKMENVKTVYIDRELMVYSIPLLFSSFMTSLMLWTDTLMLGLFMPAEEIGLYNAALPTAQLITAFPLSISGIFLSIATGLYAKNKMDDIKKLYSTITRWVFFVNIPILFLFVFFSQQVLRELFGGEYVAGYAALIILGLGFFLRFIFPASQVLNILKKTRHVMYINIVAAIGNIGLNYTLIPVLGITGAAISTAASHVLINAMFIAISYRDIRFIPLSLKNGKSVAAGFISMGTVYLVSRSLFDSFNIYILAGLLAVFMSLYVMLSLLLRCFDSDDVEMIKVVESKTGLRIGFIRNFLKRFMK
jgi:O-antigen/teichoic acid export membrane protein